MSSKDYIKLNGCLGFLLFALMCSGILKCGPAPRNDHKKVPYGGVDTRKFKTISPPFIDVVNKFTTEFDVSSDHLGVGYEFFYKNIVGLCFSYSNGLREIRINPHYEEIITDPARFEQLMYHELGHCLLNLEHNDDHEDEKPESIMRSWLFSTDEISEYYIPHRDEYINELNFATPRSP